MIGHKECARSRSKPRSTRSHRPLLSKPAASNFESFFEIRTSVSFRKSRAMSCNTKPRVDEFVTSSGAEAARSHPPAADRLAHIDRQGWLWQSHEEALRSFRNAYGLMMQLVWDELAAVIEPLDAGHPLRDPAFDFRNSSQF